MNLVPFYQTRHVVRKAGWKPTSPVPGGQLPKSRITDWGGCRPKAEWHPSEKHLDYYLDAFAFRFNRRRSPDRNGEPIQCVVEGAKALPLAPLHFAAEDFEEPHSLGLDNLHAVIGSAGANAIELVQGDADLAVDR